MNILPSFHFCATNHIAIAIDMLKKIEFQIFKCFYSKTLYKLKSIHILDQYACLLM